MSVRTTIKKYYVFHMARDRNRDLRHSITCYSDTDGYKNIGTLYFYKNSVDLPENTSNGLHFRTSQFDGVVETLRVESPVTYFFSDRNYCGIYTGQEPVGEEEGAAG